uniref:FMRFamide-5 n=1 Tax=Lucilia cuprina TaxID=7375 RepID=FAR5_LUCCU|nr:RecName: Full=FMRFamide-5; AltName: Full=LucFMRFamide-5 [Lucilia cuprina]
SPTQDFMRF